MWEFQRRLTIYIMSSQRNTRKSSLHCLEFGTGHTEENLVSVSN